jgi:3-hydroxyisobutyrate dehydrogenase
MTERPEASIGFVGLGRMGAPMAARLIKAGHRVVGYDVSQAARNLLAEHGGRPVSTLAETARADVIILMLPDSTAVTAVLRDSAFLSGLSPGMTIIDMGSSEPMVTRRLSAELGSRGVSLFDAPVSGGVKGAQDGKLTIMVGAPQGPMAEIFQLLSPLGRVVHAGHVGAGHAVKALNNLLSATHLLATSEAMRVGEKFGLDPETMLEIFNSSSGRSGSTEAKWPRFIATGKYDSGFALRLMVKDMRIATKLGDDLGLPMELGQKAEALWEEAADALPSAADHTCIATWAESRPHNNPARKSSGSAEIKVV